MSPKTRVGRDPFAAAGRKKSAPADSPRAQKSKRPVRERSYRRSRRRTPPGFTELFEEITHYWLPRIRACVYVRAVKAFSRFA